MPNLQSLCIHRNVFDETGPLSSQPRVLVFGRLQSLTLVDYCHMPDDGSPLGDLGGLRSLSIIFEDINRTYSLTKEFAVGRMLLNCRDTLKELSLNSFKWSLDHAQHSSLVFGHLRGRGRK
ncbi:hypothetical protein BOTBODRAFT_170742 [Botryobasidium botryosum FD-172 SS1]|uniref:Uncharacterized protein n=1 Tax=Botryobasidium botryosum (strain FD-172 SS1) TaxID=930990 RepID=A0A067MVB4_BOTB1|nr:hypothetical protein BOTBODRAFT_170742 [Botryobasidium botryosum FD-172 SS1]